MEINMSDDWRWRIIWRNGIAPIADVAGLYALRDALRSDDLALVQGNTTVPPPLMSMSDYTCNGACALAFIAWRERELDTVGEVEERFARMCYEIDERIGEPAAVRWFLNWFDETPRDEMRRLLLEEVERSLAEWNHEEERQDVEAGINQDDQLGSYHSRSEPANADLGERGSCAGARASAA